MHKFYEPVPPPKHPTPNFATPEERKKYWFWNIFGIVGAIATLAASCALFPLLGRLIGKLFGISL